MLLFIYLFCMSVPVQIINFTVRTERTGFLWLSTPLGAAFGDKVIKKKKLCLIN